MVSRTLVTLVDKHRAPATPLHQGASDSTSLDGVEMASKARQQPEHIILIIPSLLVVYIFKSNIGTALTGFEMTTEASQIPATQTVQLPRGVKCQQKRNKMQEFLLSELNNPKSKSKEVLRRIIGAWCVMGRLCASDDCPLCVLVLLVESRE